MYLLALSLMFVTALTLSVLCSSENAPTCSTEAAGTQGEIFMAQDAAGGTEINVLAADFSTSFPSSGHEFTKTATVSLPSQTTLGTYGVSDFQHERLVVTSTGIVTLTQDALIIIYSEDGRSVLLPIDADCEPQRLYTLDPDDIVYVLCRNRSRVLKLTSDSNLQYHLNEIPWDLDHGVHSPAVAFSHEGSVAAAVLKRDTYKDDTYEYDYNLIEVKPNIDVDTQSVVCVDTYYIDPSCDSAENRLLPFNNTHLIIECAVTKQFLLDILSLNCFNQVGITALELQPGAKGTEVGPDKDTFVVNYGTYLFVQRQSFKESHICNVGQQISRFDHVGTDYIVLFTAAGMFSCNLGVVAQLSPLAIAYQFFAYFINKQHLFVATSSSSTAIMVFNVEDACQFVFGSASSISVSPGPLQIHVLAFIEGPPSQVFATPNETAYPSILSTPAVTFLAEASATISPVNPTDPPSQVFATPNETAYPSILSTPAVTSLIEASATISPVGPTSFTLTDLTPFHVAAVVASVISGVVLAGIVTLCVMLLCRSCRRTKPTTSPEIGIDRSPSVASTLTSVNSGIQETGSPIPASTSHHSNFLPSWERNLITPVPETRPLVECVVADLSSYRSGVRSELYLTVPYPETCAHYQYSPDDSVTEL